MPARLRDRKLRFSVVLYVYLAMLAVYLIAAFFPQNRIWGFNLWAYLPESVLYVLVLAGILVPFGLRLVPELSRIHPSAPKLERRGRQAYYGGLFCCMALIVASFFLLRARTFFLGDGYTVLSLLAADDPLIKTREIGEALAHIWVKGLFGDGQRGALLSFQAISIGSGVAFLVVTAMAGRFLFERWLDRFLFFLGMASCGYMLLFFGYVENYSLFVLLVAIYAMIGLLVILGRLRSWTVLPFLLLAIFSHVIGVTLIPSAIYLLTVRTKIGSYIARLSPGAKTLAASALLVAGFAVFCYFYFTHYFFRFAVVPIVADRFTVEGYTMFSLAHLLDFVNLLVLLAPALPIVVILLLFLPIKKLFRQREYRYLVFLLISVLGALFVFDPKLGMPRDWDLFAFAGPPLALFCFYLILDNRSRIERYASVSLLSVALGFLTLFPRAISQATPDISVEWFDNYATLDVAKNMIGRTLVKEYYENAGDSAAAERRFTEYVSDYPEWVANWRGLALKQSGRCADAIPLFETAIGHNPMFAAAWANIGSCYTMLQKHDSAVAALEVAAGMNPYNYIVWSNLGKAHYSRGAYREAEKATLKAYKYGPDKMSPILGLVKIYQKLNRPDKYLYYLTKLVERDDAPLSSLRELGENYLNQHEYDKASAIYRRAVREGLDSGYVRTLKEEFPQLSW